MNNKSAGTLRSRALIFGKVEPLPFETYLTTTLFQRMQQNGFIQTSDGHTVEYYTQHALCAFPNPSLANRTLPPCCGFQVQR